MSEIKRRKFKDITLPTLSLGCMRLPTKDGEIDMQELDKMVAHAFSKGSNYFDTAYMYHDGKSEVAIGEALKKYPRESFYLADKSPSYVMQTKEDIHRIFQEQLDRCQVDYFDFYLVHNIFKGTYDTYKNLEMYNELLRYKESGAVKYLGFSFHGDVEMFEKVINEHPWDFCQLQINYLDWEMINAKKLYELATKANVPIIVMEPIRGGALCNLVDEASEKLKETIKDDTQASFALRWVADRENVLTILSGMNNLDQIKENIETFVEDKKFSDEETKAAQEVAKIIQSKGEIPCTGCKYCLEVCPVPIKIPAIFTLYNQLKADPTNPVGELFFSLNYSSLDDKEMADKCLKCNLCSQNCPQNLDIATLLENVDNTLKDINSRVSL